MNERIALIVRAGEPPILLDGATLLFAFDPSYLLGTRGSSGDSRNGAVEQCFETLYQPLSGGRKILGLGPPFRRCHHDTGGQMNDPYAGHSLIAVLAPGAAAFQMGDLEIFIS